MHMVPAKMGSGMLEVKTAMAAKLGLKPAELKLKRCLLLLLLPIVPIVVAHCSHRAPPAPGSSRLLPAPPAPPPPPPPAAAPTDSSLEHTVQVGWDRANWHQSRLAQGPDSTIRHRERMRRDPGCRGGGAAARRQGHPEADQRAGSDRCRQSLGNRHAVLQLHAIQNHREWAAAAAAALFSVVRSRTTFARCSAGARFSAARCGPAGSHRKAGGTTRFRSLSPRGCDAQLNKWAKSTYYANSIPYKTYMTYLEPGCSVGLPMTDASGLKETNIQLNRACHALSGVKPDTKITADIWNAGPF